MIWIYGDDNRDRRRIPIITPLLILVNLWVFFSLQECGANKEFTQSFATVPAEIVSGGDLGGSVEEAGGSAEALGGAPLPIYLTLITSLFLHAGLFHLLGNVLFLFVFGDNVEDRLGRLRFLLFYLVCGVFASLGHVASIYLLDGGSPFTPLIGASGAISGVLGGYLIYYPRKKVKMFFLLLFIPIRFRLRAVVVISIWFALQVFSGVARAGSGVAYGAHIVGFLTGILLVLLLRNSVRRQRFSIS